MTTTQAVSYRTQADAVKAIRLHIWGTETSRNAEFIRFTEWLDTYNSTDSVVAADVNGDLVVFKFDNWGRLDQRQVTGTGRPLVIKRAAR